MKVALDPRKTLEENAQRYFEMAKKARRKAAGAEKAVAEWRRRLEKTPEEEPRRVEKRRVRKREWFEKFRWCRSSDDFLMLAGRDATTNEMLVKRHAQPGDVLFHTDMAGAPFVLVKAEKREVPMSTMEEAAQFCASFSRAWKNGLSALEVFHVAPEQATKEAQPGEYLGKGAFMIRGKTTYMKPELRAAVGVDEDGRVMAGPPASVEAHCEAVEVFQGNEKTSDVAKEIRRRVGGDLDDIVSALPPGGCSLRRR